MTAVTELWWCPTFCIWKCHQLEVILPPRGELNRVHEGIRRAPNERTPREANIRKSALDAHSFVSLTLRRLSSGSNEVIFFFTVKHVHVNQSTYLYNLYKVSFFFSSVLQFVMLHEGPVQSKSRISTALIQIHDCVS